MSLIRFYVRHEKLILPTVAETEAGFYIDLEPIDVFEIRELELWRHELYLRLINGNPLVPTPERSDDPGSAILERLNITKWSTFETSAIMYTIHVGGRYITVYRTGKGADGMWTQENTDLRHFASRAPLSWIANEVAADVIKQPEANRPKTGLILAPQAEPKLLSNTTASAPPAEPKLLSNPAASAPPAEPKLLSNPVEPAKPERESPAKS